MDIELLKTFLEVKKTRHFGRAAENLYLTQAAVSARIKQMEEFFGVPLFLRKRNNLQLTVEGERLVPHAETMLMAWRRARQDVALKTEQTDQLSIGATAGLWEYGYKSKLPMIYRALPRLALRSEVHESDALLKMVLERSLDLAILFDAPTVPELTTRPAGKLKLILASTVAGATFKSALKENYIYVDWGTAFNTFHAKRCGEAAPAVLYTTMASNAEAFMAQCPASAFLPSQMVADSAVKLLRAVAGAPACSRDVSIVYRGNSEKLPLLEQVLGLLKL